MGSVGDKAPTLSLVGLQLFGQGVELPPEFADLIVAGDGMPIAVVAGGDDVHAVGERVQAAQNHPGKRQRQQKNQSADDQREYGDALPYGEKQTRQIPVVLIQSNRAANPFRRKDGDGNAADKVRSRQSGLKRGFAPKRGLEILRIEISFAAVIDRAAVRTDYGRPVKIIQIHSADYPCNLIR